jgi:hypothetical protein
MGMLLERYLQAVRLRPHQTQTHRTIIRPEQRLKENLD